MFTIIFILKIKLFSFSFYCKHVILYYISFYKIAHFVIYSSLRLTESL